MGNVFYFDWEVRLMTFLQDIMGNAGTAIASFFTLFGEELFLVAILGFLFWSHNKELGRQIGLRLVAVLLWNPMLKNVFVRRRPYFDNENIRCLKPVDSSADIYDIKAQDFSFPSGHSACAGAAYGTLAKYGKNRVLSVICSILILLVGVSRFCLGVHYPTDVLAGWLLGIAAIYLLGWLQKKIHNDPVLYGILLLTAAVGFFYCKTNEFYTDYGLAIGVFSGFLFEKKFVRFENTKKLWEGILRVIVGVALFFGLNTLLKLPFDTAFLESGTFPALIVRTLRYAILSFILIGIYPITFRWKKR